MKIDYWHDLTSKEAYERINGLLANLQKKYSDKISNPKTTWNPEHTQMDYSIEIMGFKTEGKVHLRGSQITLEGKLPGIAKMASGRIKKMIKTQLDESFSSISYRI